MLKDLKNPRTICAIFSAILAAAILVMQFIPYWSFEQVDYKGDIALTQASIADFIWFPKDNSGMLDVVNEGISILDEELRTTVNDVALPTVLQFVFAIATIVLCLWKPGVSVVSLLGVVCGGMGVYGNIFVRAAFGLNPTLWIVNLVLSALLLITSIVQLLSDQIFKKKAVQ